MFTIGQWLNLLGICAEAIGLLILLSKTPTRDDVRNQAWKIAHYPQSLEPDEIETQKGQMKIAIPIIVGLILQALGTILP